ncbi:MAG: peptidoglycan-binding protein [Ignavibacteria bacterium]|nr:peptidoglycan-binding protein [Ignavibacteria bacterium]
MIYTASQYIGVREATGNNDGYEVEMFLASAGLRGQYPWCGAFVTFVHKKCGYEVPNSPAWAPSWFKSSKVISPDKVVGGEVFGIYYQSKKRIAHVGICEKIKSNVVITIEGNTNEMGSREGDGVYKKRRPVRTINKFARWYE